MNSLIFQLFKTVLLSQIQFGMILYLIINLFICIPLFLTILTEISILPILTFTKYLSYRIYTSETKLTHYFKASWIYILHRNIFIIFRIYYTVLIHFLVLCTIIFLSLHQYNYWFNTSLLFKQFFNYASYNFV